MINPFDQLADSIRKIVCTVEDADTAKRDIEATIEATANDLGLKGMAVNLAYTLDLPDMPLKRRIKKLKQRGYRIPKEWEPAKTT